MQEQGGPFADQLAAIMVAAGPQDERATALVQALRQAGLRVVFAETVNIATRASEAAGCVVVLRPDTWKTQTIATVMHTKPDCLIPVLAERMELPRGPWTRPAISLGDEPEDGEQELIQVLRDYLVTRPASKPALRTDPLTVNMILAPRKRRRRVNIPAFITTILILIILSLGGLVGYRYYAARPGKSTAVTTPGSNSTAATQFTYTAKTPGTYCDPNGGQWGVGDRYIKTVKGKKTEVVDKYTTLQCQSNGALLTRSGDYDVYSELFFYGPSYSTSLSTHYSFQVDATIISGDAQADITMDTHIQDNGYGRYNFDVNALGHWEANTASTVDGSSINRQTIGFLPQGSKTYTLKVEVNGPLMTFWIDGVQVTTVTDTTYIDNDSVGFGVDDWSASKPISALFSNFKYAELTPGALVTPEFVATATSQAQSSAQTPYTARVPGYDCDKGAGQWQPLADANSPGAIHCLSGGMQLTSPANVEEITEEDFYWLNGHFPANYKVSAQINVSEASEGCAGLATRVDTGGDSYAFIICPNGSWEINLLFNDKFHTLAEGRVNAQGTYTITAKLDGSTQSLYVNGQLLKTVNDSHLKSTDHLALYSGFYQSSRSQSATFSNFVFTPLA